MSLTLNNRQNINTVMEYIEKVLWNHKDAICLKNKFYMSTWAISQRTTEIYSIYMYSIYLYLNIQYIQSSVHTFQTISHHLSVKRQYLSMKPTDKDATDQSIAL